jgi:uncharacterized protein YlxW (UPF0749 family)
MEDIAVEVLGQQSLRAWYDSTRKESVMRERLLHQYQTECDKLAKDMTSLKKQRKTESDALEAQRVKEGDPVRFGVEHRALKVRVFVCL